MFQLETGRALINIICRETASGYWNTMFKAACTLNGLIGVICHVSCLLYKSTYKNIQVSSDHMFAYVSLFQCLTYNIFDDANGPDSTKTYYSSNKHVHVGIGSVMVPLKCDVRVINRKCLSYVKNASKCNAFKLQLN